MPIDMYVSALIALAPGVSTLPESIADQARQCFENVKAVLEAAGSSLDKVVRVGLSMVDLADFKTVNEIYAEYFSKEYPARATVQAAALALGAKIAVEAVAEA